MAAEEPMQESWVEVKEQQEGGTLTHTSSKQELKQLLASAASEEEEVSDTDQFYQVTFQAAAEDSSGTQPEEDVPATHAPLPPIKKLPSRHVQYQPQIPPVQSIPVMPVTKTQSSFGNGICSLSLLVPVIILTHIAMFGIGYYFGRRWSCDGSGAAMKVFHV